MLRKNIICVAMLASCVAMGCSLNLTGNVPDPNGTTTKTGGSAANGGGEPAAPASSATSDDAGPGTTEDAGASSKDAGSPPAACQPQMVAPSEVPAWRSPKAPLKGSCSASDVSELESITKTAQNYSQVYGDTNISNACRACAFSQLTDATWNTLVFDPKTGNGYWNLGACLASRSGGTAQCGQAAFYLETCSEISCSACTTTADYSACEASSTKTMCGNDATMYQSSCNSQQVSECGDTYLSSILAMCGS
jgi:hypothetical protein